MAKLDRKNVKIFSSNPNDATQVTTFLTAKDATPSISSDPDIIQNANYEKGWLADGNNNLPQCEDMNGVMFTESYKTAYLYQQGIAEWIVTQEYCTNSFCQVAGVLYQSKTDNNIGNDPTEDDGTNWTEISLAPYDGDNLGTAEGIFANKTANNVLQFKGLAVSGNGNISASNDTITIEIGGGGTGDVYWGAIGGTLSNQSDLQQALNQKQGIIGYTPEDVANKVTTIRTDTIATDTAYPTELATRTAIDDAISDANEYTDNALQGLSSNAFVLYANSWTDVYTGTLTTTAPTGTGTAVQLTSVGSSYENIANFTYTTTAETQLNNTFTYDILIPIRSADLKEWTFKIKLTIENASVNSGLPTTLVEYETSQFFPPNNQNLNIEIKQDNLNLTAINYPAGSEIKFNIQAKCESNSYNLDLLIYDQTYPLTISRNRSVNKNLVTAFNTQVTGTLQNQEYLNYLLYNNKQDKLRGWNFGYNGTQATLTPIAGSTSYIGTSTYPVTSIDCGTVNTTNVEVLNVYSDYSQLTMAPTNSDDVYFDLGSSGDQSTGSYYFRINDTTKFRVRNADVRTYADLLPSTNNAYDLGSSSNIFAEGYFNNTISNTVTTDEIAPKTTVTSTSTIEKTIEINKINIDWTSVNEGNLNAVDISCSEPYGSPDTTQFKATLGQKQEFYSVKTANLILGGTNYTSIPSAPNNGSYAIKLNGATKGTVYADGTGANTIDLGTVITSTSDCVKIAGSTMTGGLTINFNDNNQITLKRNNNSVVLFNDVSVSNAYRPKFSYKIDGTTYTAVAAKNAWNFASDRRLKKNIKSIKNGLEIVEKLNPVKFDFKNDERNDGYESGFIAQEVKEVIPQAITEDENGYLSLGMNSITPYLAGAIKELNEKIKKLEARIEELENDGRE